MSKVIIQECTEYNVDKVIKKINKGVELLGGWNKFIKPMDIVLLKINLIGPKPPDSAAVTNCEFVRAIIRILKEYKCTVWIGDSSGGAIAGVAPTTQSFKVAGYEDVAREEGAIIKNFDKSGVVEISSVNDYKEKMYLAKPVFDADVVINLPKLKTHTAGIYTGAVKNVFGCIPGLRKAKYHKDAPNPLDFGEILANIHRGAKFHLHIMDGIISMEGEGPTAGNSYKSNKILISEDPLALDTVALQMIGLKIEDIPILDASRKNNIGVSDLDNIFIEGDSKSIPILDNFKLPKRFKSSKKQNYNALVKVINFLKTRPKINQKNVSIVIYV